MDILYTVKNCNICEELAYSLRSLSNLPHNNIFFVGGFPNNIKRVDIIHIPTIQRQTKWKNTTENLKIACNYEKLSDDFILMNDDFFILKPIKEEDLYLNQGTIEEVYRRYRCKYAIETSYMQGMRQTKQYLEQLGIKNPLSFELHIPMIMNKQKFLEMLKLPNIKSISVLHKRSLYGNLYYNHSAYQKDVKILYTDRKIVLDDRFLSSSDNSWKRLKPILENIFPSKSIYEF